LILSDEPIKATVVATDVVTIKGVIPGVTCSLNRPNELDPWTNLQTDTLLTTDCSVVQDVSGFQGRAVVPASYVNKGYFVRIQLFWLTNPDFGPWDY
jgi:hypothetical protein